MQFFLPSHNITIPKQYKKRKIVFSLKLSGEYCVYFFIVNQINQWYLSNNEASRHHIYVNNTHRKKLCVTSCVLQEFIETEAWLHQTFFICQKFKFCLRVDFLLKTC